MGTVYNDRNLIYILYQNYQFIIFRPILNQIMKYNYIKNLNKIWIEFDKSGQKDIDDTKGQCLVRKN